MGTDWVSSHGPLLGSLKKVQDQNNLWEIFLPQQVGSFSEAALQGSPQSIEAKHLEETPGSLSKGEFSQVTEVHSFILLPDLLLPPAKCHPTELHFWRPLLDPSMCIWHGWNRAPHLFSCTFPVPHQQQAGWYLWETGLGRKRWGMEQNGQTRHYPTKAFSAIRPGLLGCSGLTEGLLCHPPLSMETSPNSYLDEWYKTIINEDIQFCLFSPWSSHNKLQVHIFHSSASAAFPVGSQTNLSEVCTNTHCYKIPFFIH